jgi:5-methylcytosine-specific restriction protein B
MRQQHAEDVYVLYDKFITEFLIAGNSILTSDTDILTQQTIQNCFTNYVENFKEGGDTFNDKIIEQFKVADLSTRLVFAHAEWLWAFAVNDKKQSTKKEYTKRTTGVTDGALLKDVYPKGFGSAGQWHNQNKYWEIKFNLICIRFVRQKIVSKEISKAEEAKQWIEHLCLYQKYEKETNSYPIPESIKPELPDSQLAVCNILTYAGNPDNYERIASISHKQQIVDAFSSLLPVEAISNKSINTDDKIALIRKELGTLTGNPQFDFYEDEGKYNYRQVWNYSLSEEGYSEVQGLQYKKAIIIYGPPGTSKTHTASRLANALISNKYLLKRENVVKYFRGDTDFLKGKIHLLQLHQNYSYEDFIAGIQLKNNNTEVTKGKLFAICEAANADKGTQENDDMPHVLILDEINRVDLSRLFGEAFSALENREKPIEVAAGRIELTIPRNLYVIGTMNEIDFSLERIDFALRRRFLWFFYGFDRNSLSEIIWTKDADCKTRLREEEVERFINNAQELNNAITKLPELGQQYQIGHTFFGEIVNIYKSYKDLIGLTNRLQRQIYRSWGPAYILWQISIEPILNAFLGNMDLEAKNLKISELKAIYNK